MLLRRRAQELVSLADKTIEELSGDSHELSGEISIGLSLIHIFIHSFQKSDAADLEQILHLHPSSQKTLCHTVYQSCIFLKPKISCRFIPLVSCV